MTKEEILDYFEQAKKDWERPIWKCILFGYRNTHSGLCHYFKEQHFIVIGSKRMNKLCSYWITYRTKYSAYHFNSREERIYAINMVIKQIKQQADGK